MLHRELAMSSVGIADQFLALVSDEVDAEHLPDPGYVIFIFGCPRFERGEFKGFERVVEGAERYRDMLIESDVFCIFIGSLWNRNVPRAAQNCGLGIRCLNSE